MEKKDILLDIKDLSVEFRTDDGVVKAVNHMDLQLEKGKTLGLVGETGAGKTTTALSILRLVPDPPGVITGGAIELDGHDILKASNHEMKKLRGSLVSMIFQDPMTSLNPVVPVGTQIAEVFILHNRIGKIEAEERAGEMLEMVGIPASRGKDYPHQFSGGMKQRVVIAMALACNPKLLIADEPTTALDVTIQAQVLKLMKELKQKYNMAIVADVCDEVSVMYAGRVVEHGTLEDVYERTAHPYTEGLFNSIPNIEARTHRLIPIRGLMPDPTDLPSGCPFHPRCSYATEECKMREPVKTELSDTHYVYCILRQRESEKHG